MITVVYVDDLIFGSNEEGFSQTFAKEMVKEFEVSMIGKLTYFLGLQISQDPTGIFVSQSNYLKEMLKIFGMMECSHVSTPMITSCKLRK